MTKQIVADHGLWIPGLFFYKFYIACSFQVITIFTQLPQGILMKIFHGTSQKRLQPNWQKYLKQNHMTTGLKQGKKDYHFQM